MTMFELLAFSCTRLGTETSSRDKVATPSRSTIHSSLTVFGVILKTATALPTAIGSHTWFMVVGEITQPSRPLFVYKVFNMHHRILYYTYGPYNVKPRI